MATVNEPDQYTVKPSQRLDQVVIRFAGDSGDGMQLAGSQFSRSSAIFGNDVSTFPDYPAEIRAPSGSLAGVSGFQINFSSRDVHTPGDAVDALVAFNPAALKASLEGVRPGGVVIVNQDSFGKTDLKRAGYDANPLEDGALTAYRVHPVPISRLTREALKESGLGTKEVDRCRNFFALGLIYWLYGRSMQPTTDWIEDKFGKSPAVAGANLAALKAGYYYGETCELFESSYQVDKAVLPAGTYRRVSGNEALSLGLIAASCLSGRDLFYGSYPITPASDILHTLSRHKRFGVKTFQAEDEIAAMTAAIGAAYAGDLAATGTSGPGLALKGEAIGLAVMTELPVVIINVQRAGPSTGMPTKTEQADLFQALFGRHGECPVCVLAAASPADCFDVAVEACRIALRYMTPVILLSDGYIGNGEEPWAIPEPSKLAPIQVARPGSADGDGAFLPYERDEDLSRPWALPGTPGLEHRAGGLEKTDKSGTVNYEPQNHERMVQIRAQKIAGIVRGIPDQTVRGPESGDILVLAWGGTTGATHSAVERLQNQGHSVAWTCLRYLNPFPSNLGEVMSRYRHVLIPELNSGQLRFVIRATFGVDAVGLNKIRGQPLLIGEIEAKLRELLPEGKES